MTCIIHLDVRFENINRMLKKQENVIASEAPPGKPTGPEFLRARFGPGQFSNFAIRNPRLLRPPRLGWGLQ
jgi:hypothetical protein